MDRTHAGIILIGVGIPLIVVSVLSGGMSPGFELEIPMVLLRVGVMFVLLGVVTLTLRAISVEAALTASIVALALVFVAGMAVMYYDFITTTPTRESPLTVTMVVANQAGITIALAPIPAGYVAGVLERQGQSSTAYRILIGTTVAAWMISSFVDVSSRTSVGVDGGVRYDDGDRCDGNCTLPPILAT